MARLSQARLGRSPTRRQFLLAMGAGLIGAACSRGAARRARSTPAGSIASLTEGASTLSILGTGSDAPPMNPGRNRFAFVLVDSQSRAVEGGTPHVWIARDPNDNGLGPFPATWYPFTAYAKTGDRSPESPLPGNFATEIDVPSPGNWTIAVTVQTGSRRLAGTGILPITGTPVVAGVGTKAISAPTPVATANGAIEAVCTRTPVDRMHYISLAEALVNGKPTVACFSTPLLCTSMLCGPVTDEQILVFQKYGSDRANFIHVEEFLPGPDHMPPPATLGNRSPAFKAWKLESEPWVFVIDAHSVIRFRSLGPVTGPEIEAALKPVL